MPACTMFGFVTLLRGRVYTIATKKSTIVAIFFNQAPTSLVASSVSAQQYDEEDHHHHHHHAASAPVPYGSLCVVRSFGHQLLFLVIFASQRWPIGAVIVHFRLHFFSPS